MLDETILQRLAASITPDDAQRLRIKSRMQRSIEPVSLRRSVEAVSPSSSLRRTLKQRILGALPHASLAKELRRLQDSVFLSGPRTFSLRQMILGRLAPEPDESFMHGSLKWVASFAVFLLLIRAMPLVFLVPPTKADVGVQLIPVGHDVSAFIGGVWRNVTTPEVVSGPLMIRTVGDSKATLILNDDGVIRIGTDTTFKLHDIGDRPQFAHAGPTATLVRGQIWVLGLLPPVTESISIETANGSIDINSGSASIREDSERTTITLYDRGATFRHDGETSFLVSGERGIANADGAFSIVKLPVSAFADAFVSQHLEQDAVHRTEIGKLQQERRARMAGILPTSILYSAKRIAEQVDVLFTLTHDGRMEKRIRQADTRLSEALALVKEGQNTEAAVPLTEYRDSLVAMAGGTGDNLVKYLLKKHIADASVSVDPQTSSGKIQLVRSAIVDVSASIPDTALQSRDIEGYVLVSKLTEINHMIAVQGNLSGALLAYADVSPYLQALLAQEGGAHPLLQKEATSLLVSTSSLIKQAARDSQNSIVVAVQTDLDQYLPDEPDTTLVSEAELQGIIDGILKRIFIFKAPLSRYNQLLHEMSELRGNPNRGTLLRRLYRALPELGLGEYVLTEIKNFGDELKGR